MDIERLKELKQRIEDIHWQINSQIAFSLLCDLLPLVDEAIARQSVKSEDVAEAIEQLRSEYLDDFDGYSPETCGKWNRNIDLAITALQAYRPWVPVSERLPDDINEYLIVIKHKYECEKKWQYDVDVATSNGSYLNNFWDTDNDWDEGQEIHVTHWQPLPEPLKGE